MTIEELLREVEDIRSEVEKKDKLGLRAREDIYNHLDKALECLEERDTPRSRNEAAFRIGIARQRIRQTEQQKHWLAVPIGFWMVALGGVCVGFITAEELWPQSDKIAVGCVLLGSVLWGTLGAAINGLRELHTRLARQELDTNRLGWYFAHPIIGAGIGGILFLVVTGGLLMTGQDVEPYNPSLPLLLAALAGFEQQHVIRYLRDVVRHILRIEEPSPDEGG